MKRLFGVLAILVCSAAGAATLNPIQLLNPTGSTAGQAIVSTGPSSAPAWATVSVSAPTGTLPVFNGGTGATDAATARLNLGAAATAGTLGQFATTTSGQLAGVLSDETGSGSAVFGTSPTITTPSITGVTNGGNAASGAVGEFLSNSATGMPLTNNTPANATSVPLTAGDWDVSCLAGFAAAGTTTLTNVTVGVGIASATFQGLAAGGSISFDLPGAGGRSATVSSPVYRISFASSGTAFCVVQATFGVSTLTVNGFIRARRMR